MTKERTDYADWSSFLSAEDYRIVFSIRMSLLDSVTSVLNPFSRKMWVALLTTVFVMQLFLWRSARKLLSENRHVRSSALYQVLTHIQLKQLK